MICYVPKEKKKKKVTKGMNENKENGVKITLKIWNIILRKKESDSRGAVEKDRRLNRISGTDTSSVISEKSKEREIKNKK